MVQADVGKTGFDKHTDDDHNMWMYMYYLIHIGEIEDKTELNGIESYVYEKSKISDVGFFPVGRSMRLDVLGGIPDPQKEVLAAPTTATHTHTTHTRYTTHTPHTQLHRHVRTHSQTKGKISKLIP